MNQTIDTKVREAVAEHFIRQMENASPLKRERIIRLLIYRLPRNVVDGIYIAQTISSDSRSLETDHREQ